MDDGLISRCGRKAAMLLALFCLVAAVCAHAGDSQAAEGDAPESGMPVSSSLMQALEQVSRAGLHRDIQPAANRLIRISGPPVAEGKPGVLYMGADYCPYCAVLRWPLVVALLRFGQFNDLRYMRSSASDAYPDTITFSFHKADYSSPYLVFQGVELSDRAGNSLGKPDAHQTTIFRTYDSQPYTSIPGAIPFLYIGGRYMSVGAPFSPKLFKNLTWQQAVNRIGQKNTALSRHVLGVANLYTAAFCEITQGAPSRVCSAPAVKAAASRLPDASQ